MRDGFDQGHVGVEDVLENVFGVAGGADAEDFEGCSLALDLFAQLLEHLDGVLDRIAVGELVGLAEDLAVGSEHGCFGGG